MYERERERKREGERERERERGREREKEGLEGLKSVISQKSPQVVIFLLSNLKSSTHNPQSAYRHSCVCNVSTLIS